MADENDIGKAEAVKLSDIRDRSDFSTEEEKEFVERVVGAYNFGSRLPSFEKLTIRGDVTKLDSFGDASKRYQCKINFFVSLLKNPKAIYKIAWEYLFSDENEVDIPKYIDGQLSGLVDTLTSELRDARFDLGDQVLFICKGEGNTLFPVVRKKDDSSEEQ